jgi:hypothetical protein
MYLNILTNVYLHSLLSSEVGNGVDNWFMGSSCGHWLQCVCYATSLLCTGDGHWQQKLAIDRKEGCNQKM